MKYLELVRIAFVYFFILLGIWLIKNPGDMPLFLLAGAISIIIALLLVFPLLKKWLNFLLKSIKGDKRSVYVKYPKPK